MTKLNRRLWTTSKSAAQTSAERTIRRKEQTLSDHLKQRATGDDHEQVKYLMIAKHARKRIRSLFRIGQRPKRVQNASTDVKSDHLRPQMTPLSGQSQTPIQPSTT